MVALYDEGAGASKNSRPSTMDRNGLTVTQEIVMCFWKNAELVAIERKNGHLERYMTEPATWGRSTELFGADQQQPLD